MAMRGATSVCGCGAKLVPILIQQLGASMTLVGLLPPLCDNGSMLVDGGYREYFGYRS